MFAFLATSDCPLPAAGEPVFSGPQPGEAFKKFTIQGLFGDEVAKKIDPIANADNKPTLLVFFHEKTRPAFGLMNTITRYAASRRDKGMHVFVVFLSDDRTEIGSWAKNVRQHLPQGVSYGVYPDGIEGPGVYGLNRNVKLTILVGDKGKVTDNFAISQPQLAVDGPAILSAITKVTGGGAVPTIESLQRGAGRGMMNRNQQDPKLTGMLRRLINKQASDEEVKAAEKSMDEYLSKNQAAQKEIARITSTIINADKLGNYGTPAAQAVLKKWRAKYGAKSPATKGKEPAER